MVTTPMEPVNSSEPNSPPPRVTQFAFVKLQPAAHRPDLAGIEARIDEVLEIRRAVFSGHFKQKIGVFGVPVEIFRQVVGGDRVGKAAAVRVSGDEEF